MGLWDAVMIKDNHVAITQSIGQTVGAARASGITKIIVEVDRVDQIEPAIAAGATHLLLANMEPAILRGAVTLGGRTGANRGIWRSNARYHPRHCRYRRDLCERRPSDPVGSCSRCWVGFRCGLIFRYYYIAAEGSLSRHPPPIREINGLADAKGRCGMSASR